MYLCVYLLNTTDFMSRAAAQVMQPASAGAYLQARYRACSPVSTAHEWVPEQAADCSHGLTPGRSARQAEEVEKRNVPAGSNTTPELANDATGAAHVPLQ